MESKFLIANGVVRVNGKYIAVENQYVSYSGKWGERINKENFYFILRKFLN